MTHFFYALDFKKVFRSREHELSLLLFKKTLSQMARYYYSNDYDTLPIGAVIGIVFAVIFIKVLIIVMIVSFARRKRRATQTTVVSYTNNTIAPPPVMAQPQYTPAYQPQPGAVPPPYTGPVPAKY